MRSSLVLPLLSAATGFAAPGAPHLPTSPNQLATQAIDSASSWLHNVLHGVKHQLDDLEHDFESAVQAEKIDMHGIECALHSSL
jgi:hypothetical protein